MTHVHITSEVDRWTFGDTIHFARQGKEVCTMMHKMQVGSTDTTGVHGDQHFAFTRNWLGESVDHHVTGTQHSSFHKKTLVTSHRRGLFGYVN